MTMTTTDVQSWSPKMAVDNADEPKEGAQLEVNTHKQDSATINDTVSDAAAETKANNEDNSVDTALPAKTDSPQNGGECSDGVITKEMLEEEEHLHEETEKVEEKLKSDQEKLWGAMDQADREVRYARLQSLLNKSDTYARYVQIRIQANLEEERKKNEEREKRAQKKKQALEEKKNNTKDIVGSPREMRHKKIDSDQESVKSPGSSQGSKRGRKRKAASPAASKASKKKIADLADDSCNDSEQLHDSETSSVSKEQENKTASLTTEPQGEKVEEDRSEMPLGASPDQPSLFTGGLLRTYQIEGFNWLKTLYENGINGILADEMGLGKTVQCVAIISHLISQGVGGPFLVCAPLSTLPNWYSEFQRFTPKVPVILYHGTKAERDRKRLKMKCKVQVTPTVKAYPVVITSYEVTMKDRKLLQSFLWKYLIVDEGHRIKNTQCRLIKELRMYHNTYRLLLTGTPLQNNLGELWSLLNFLLPEVFDDLGSFEEWFDVERITSSGAEEKILQEEREKNILSIMHQVLRPFMLRRLKQDVDLYIPPKKEILVYAPLSEQQQTTYKAIVDKTIFKQVEEEEEKVEEADISAQGRPVRRRAKHKVNYRLMVENTKDKKLADEELKYGRKNEDKIEEELEAWVMAMQENQNRLNVTKEVTRPESRMNISLHNIMMHLRKCCNHPYLIDYPLDVYGNYKVDENIVNCCGKMKVLDRLLKELKNRGHKVLIFSQMTKMLDVLEDYCFLRKYNFCRLDGSCRLDDRQESISSFNKGQDNFIFLLSTRAGGLGINLTSADTVIIYDSDWNPQCDLQAQDRCHRIGQTRPVVVYRLVTVNTIDQRIVERAAAKRRLEKMIIHKGKFKGGLEKYDQIVKPLSPEDLLELLKSKDHESEVQVQDWGQRELDSLLDRSDLWAKFNRDTNERRNSTSAEKKASKPIRRKVTKKTEVDSNSTDSGQAEVQGVFKVLETDLDMKAE